MQQKGNNPRKSGGCTVTKAKMKVLLFRYTEANKSGNHCHCKDKMELTDPRRGGHTAARPHRVSQEAEGVGENGQDPIAVSVGRNRCSKVHRLGIC